MKPAHFESSGEAAQGPSFWPRDTLPLDVPPLRGQVRGLEPDPAVRGL